MDSRGALWGDLLLSGLLLDSKYVYETCGSIAVGPSVQLGASGDVGLRAGETIAIGNGFGVASGATFTAVLDDTLLPP